MTLNECIAHDKRACVVRASGSASRRRRAERGPLFDGCRTKVRERGRTILYDDRSMNDAYADVLRAALRANGEERRTMQDMRKRVGESFGPLALQARDAGIHPAEIAELCCVTKRHVEY